MIVGVPKETKVHEYRVGLTTAAVHIAASQVTHSAVAEALGFP